MKNAIDEVAADYDFILLDCPPSLSLLTLNGLCAARQRADPDAMRVLRARRPVRPRADGEESARASESRASRSRACCARCTTRATRSRRTSRPSSRSHFGDKLYRTVIPRNIRLAEAPSHGVPALKLEPQIEGRARVSRARRRDAAARWKRATRRRQRVPTSAESTEHTMIRPKGLGRGLDALLAGTDDAAPSSGCAADDRDRPHCGPASTSRARGWTTRRSTSSRNRSASRA